MPNYTAQPNPVMSYAAAVERVAALQAQDTQTVNPVCRTQLLTHGAKAERAIVFFHGLTSCPQQFLQLGTAFHKRGYNVLIPRLPHHGLTDRLTREQTKLTAVELVALGNETTNIAQGLGQQVTVAGLSAGGIVAAWVGQQRSDIAQAVLIAPVFGPKVVPTALTRPLVRSVATLPNFFRWWDPKTRAEAASIAGYSYPRFSSRALGEVIQLGFAVQAAAKQARPACQSVLVITNANDASVSNIATASVVQHWRNNGMTQLRTYEFAADLGLDHDLIDPSEQVERIDVAHPVIVELIVGELG